MNNGFLSLLWISAGLSHCILFICHPECNEGSFPLKDVKILHWRSEWHSIRLLWCGYRVIILSVSEESFPHGDWKILHYVQDDRASCGKEQNRSPVFSCWPSPADDWNKLGEGRIIRYKQKLNQCIKPHLSFWALAKNLKILRLCLRMTLAKLLLNHREKLIMQNSQYK